MTKRPSSPCCCGSSCRRAQLAEIRHALAEIGQLKKLVDPRLVAGRAAQPSRGWRSAPPIAPSRRWRCCGRFATARSRPKPAVMIGNRPDLPRHGRAVRRAWQMIGDERRQRRRRADDRTAATSTRSTTSILARYMRILPAGELLEVRRRADHQPAPRPAAQLSRHAALSRRLRQPDAHLRRDLPLHRARARRRQPDHQPIDVHRAATA